MWSVRVNGRAQGARGERGLQGRPVLKTSPLTGTLKV